MVWSCHFHGGCPRVNCPKSCPRVSCLRWSECQKEPSIYAEYTPLAGLTVESKQFLGRAFPVNYILVLKCEKRVCWKWREAKRTRTRTHTYLHTRTHVRANVERAIRISTVILSTYKAINSLWSIVVAKHPDAKNYFDYDVINEITGVTMANSSWQRVTNSKLRPLGH